MTWSNRELNAMLCLHWAWVFHPRDGFIGGEFGEYLEKLNDFNAAG